RAMGEATKTERGDVESIERCPSEGRIVRAARTCDKAKNGVRWRTCKSRTNSRVYGSSLQV
ncbi:hypothetical protein TorRG33x02_330710, partial [Trema orientale]